MTPTQEEFDTILLRLIEEDAHFIHTIPGIYEILAEHYNNEIISIYESRQEEDT